MTLSAPGRRAGRRVGYVIAAFLDAAVLYLMLVWPGWDSVPFLTGATEEVLPLVTATLVAGLISQSVYLGYDAPWIRGVGDLVTISLGLVALIAVWQVFPFDFHAYAFDWAAFVRGVLVVGIVGSAIGVVVVFVSLVRLGVLHDTRNGHRLQPPPGKGSR